MALILTGDEEQFRDSVRRVVAERSPLPKLRELMSSGQPFDTDVWKQLSALGLPALIIPAEHGGAEAGYSVLSVALGELGTGSGELFGVDFGAVVFAITLFLCEKIFSYSPRGLVALFGHTKKTKHGLRKMEVSRPALCGGFHAPRGIGESLAPVATSVKEPFLAGTGSLRYLSQGYAVNEP